MTDLVTDFGSLAAALAPLLTLTLYFALFGRHPRYRAVADAPGTSVSTSVGTPSKGVPAGGLHRELRSHERLSGRYRHHVGLGEPIVKEFSFRGGLIARRIYPRLVRPAGAVEAMARRGLALDLHPN